MLISPISAPTGKKEMKMRFLHGFVMSTLIGSLYVPGIAQAQASSFPAKPVTLIVPLAAGGPVDVETRLYAPQMQEVLGQPFLVDYKLGAAGVVAGTYVARAVPDGYTLLVMNSSYAIFPALYKNLPFDVIKDFAPVSMASKRAVLLVVSPSSPTKTFPEYLAYAKSNPGKINFGTIGAGTGIHLVGAWLHGSTGTTVTFVHYKGTLEPIADMITGRIDVSGLALSLALPMIKSGKVIAIANLADKRTPLLPDLPTVAEQGIPGFDYGSYTGFVAPGATPSAVVNKLADAFIKVAKSPSVASRLEADGTQVVGSTPAQFRQVLMSETARWKKVVMDTGMQLEQ